LIIEYDERQHFTLPRAISFQHYPSQLRLGFDVQEWNKECDRTHAVDPSPPYRDEQRAFYDSLRDILSSSNGYILLRLRHGDSDWTSEEAGQLLETVLSEYCTPRGEIMPPSSPSDMDILLGYMRRSDGNWYWEESASDILHTSNRNVVNLIGDKIRQFAGKRYRESQFSVAELRYMVSLIRSEEHRLGDIEPSADSIPQASPATEDWLRNLHAQSSIKKIALVSHDCKLRDGNRLYGYMEHFTRIAHLCDGNGCDTILCALYSWDGRSPIPRTHDTLFGGLSNVNKIILEAGDLDAHNGQPAKHDVGIEIWMRDYHQPFVVRQQFFGSPSTGDARQFCHGLSCRKVGSALLIVCGELSIVSADATESSLHCRA
jgi:hypothetical protein